MKNVNNCQIAKIQPQSVSSICLIFYQFQPDVAYKSVAYKKKHVLQLHSRGHLNEERKACRTQLLKTQGLMLKSPFFVCFRFLLSSSSAVMVKKAKTVGILRYLIS